MKARLLGFAIVASILSGCGGSSPKQDAFPPQTIAEADRQIAAIMAGSTAPGALVAVTNAGGSWIKGYRVSDTDTGASMKTDLLFRIASVTKTFTTTALLKLVDEGKMSLEDPISVYVNGVPDGEHITLRMLGDMTSGIPSYTDNEVFVAAMESDWQREWRAQELLEYAYDTPNLFPPGTDFNYSNTNTILLGLAIEKVEKRPLREVLQKRFLTPLGLEHTTWPIDNQFPGTPAHGYSNMNPERTIEDATFYNPSVGGAAGQIISSLEDLSRWTRLVGKGQLISAKNQKERLKWKPAGTNTTDFHYSFGLFVMNGWIGHSGEIAGYTLYAMYHPALDATIVVVVNSNVEGEEELLADAILRKASLVFFPSHPIGS